MQNYDDGYLALLVEQKPHNFVAAELAELLLFERRQARNERQRQADKCAEDHATIGQLRAEVEGITRERDENDRTLDSALLRVTQREVERDTAIGSMNQAYELLKAADLQYRDIIDALRLAWFSTDRPGEAFEEHSSLKAKLSAMPEVAQKPKSEGRCLEEWESLGAPFVCGKLLPCPVHGIEHRVGASQHRYADAIECLKEAAKKIPLGEGNTPKGFSSTYNALAYAAELLSMEGAEKRNELCRPCSSHGRNKDAGCLCPCHKEQTR